MDLDHLGDRIREQRKKRGFTQVTLAEVLEVSQTTVSDWESGASRPGLDRLAKIAEKLGCTAAWLLDGQSRRRAANG